MVSRATTGDPVPTSPHASDDHWEDVEDIENHPRPFTLTPSSSGSVRVGISSPRKRRFVQTRTTYIASPARKPALPPTPKKTKLNRKGVAQEEIIGHAVQGASFTLRYVFSILSIAIRLLRIPLALLAFLWLLALIVGRISLTLRVAFGPLCYVPGLYGSRFCNPPPRAIAGVEQPRWADYPKLVDIQSTTFEHLLDGSVGGSGLALEIKKAEMATTDLATLVRISNLKSRDMLSDTLGEFVEDAKKTGRDLQKLSSKIGGAVDSIMAINDHALHSIEAEQSKPPTIMSLYGLIPWSAQKALNDVVAHTFGEAMGVLASSMQRLILEAEVNIANLDKLEERLMTIHDLVSREDLSLSSAKSELLADLWTKLGGNKKKLRGFESHLDLLKNLSLYRKKALAHVVASLQALNTLSSDMEDIRERVAAPELMGPSIPIQVHMKSIKSGLERLKDGRVRAKKLEEDTVRRILGIGETSG
ncbi:hypothetical protein H0H81_007272 [Sphagnurus paluster]|uniref:Uncharacterized protein n=1 Tax=Sphagnurus paluster TaxID=117069 RepID=A0A9P7FR55_9AGAR|nr:hypothetical protein H0H81_007272 [Sphagnurus paluster]